MRLSICIPIYNFDIRPLVGDLLRQTSGASDAVEIICIDDASDEPFRTANREVASKVCYVSLEHNIGRAAIRNLFLQYAQGDYLLFLDCDGGVRSGFVQRYLDVLQQEPQGVCGGRHYPKQMDDRRHHLRYVYGVRCESKGADERSVHPHASFMTNNFVVKKDVLQRVRFDESLRQYGHEDTLFGYELCQAGIGVLHTNNEVENLDVEDNELFLEKTRCGIRNLARLYERMQDEKQFVSLVKLLRWYRQCSQLYLTGVLYVVFRALKPVLEWGLRRGIASMMAFNFYKLGLLISEFRRTADES